MPYAWKFGDNFTYWPLLLLCGVVTWECFWSGGNFPEFEIQIVRKYDEWAVPALVRVCACVCACGKERYLRACNFRRVPKRGEPIDWWVCG